MRLLALSAAIAIVLVPGLVSAQTAVDLQPATPLADAARAAADDVVVAQERGAPPPQVAAEYSRGYEIRRKIHIYASLATLPLFGTEIVLGQKLYDGGASDGVKSAHGAVAGGIAALFGVNTVTGVWNLWEARKDPHGRSKRLVHGLLMLAADGGFAATGALAPEHDEGGGNRSLHRSVALTSIGLATTSYLIMLFNR